MDTVKSFRRRIQTVGTSMNEVKPRLLEKCAEIVKKEAEKAFGEDYWEPGPPLVSPWPELADHTKVDKERLGATGRVSEYDTNLRTGETRDSIRTSISKDSFSVGSNSKIMEWIELGTTKMPPRSVLAGALNRTSAKCARVLSSGMVSKLVGREVFEGEMVIRKV